MPLFSLESVRLARPLASMEPALESVRERLAAFPHDPEWGEREEILEAFDAARPRLNILAAALQNAGVRRVLDISTGLGFLPVLVQLLGMTVWATERDPEVAAFARAGGVEVLPYTLGRDQPLPLVEPVQAVVLGEVLEHVKVPPARLIRDITSPLVPGGLLLLTTPNVARAAHLETLAAGENFLEPFPEEIPPGADPTDFLEHVREYSIREVVEALEDAGLGVESVSMTGWGERGYQPPVNPWSADIIVAAARR